MDCSRESLFSFAIINFQSKTYGNVIFIIVLYGCASEVSFLNP